MSNRIIEYGDSEHEKIYRIWKNKHGGTVKYDGEEWEEYDNGRKFVSIGAQSSWENKYGSVSTGGSGVNPGVREGPVRNA